MAEQESVDSIGPKERSRYENQLVPDHFRQRQIETLANVVLLPSSPVTACYSAKPVSPPWDDVWPGSKGEGPI